MKLKREYGFAAGVAEGSEHQSLEVVEGTDQCRECQRFMKLGEADLCISLPDEDRGPAEIVGWVPGECSKFLEATGSF